VTAGRPWWERPGLDAPEGRLRIAGREVEALAAELGTPLYAYDLDRVGENAIRLRDALAATGLTTRVRFAIKANPEPAFLAVLRAIGSPGGADAIGIDACSPGEVRRALDCGWQPEEISFTGTNLSGRDLDVLLETGPSQSGRGQPARPGRPAGAGTVGRRPRQPRSGRRIPRRSRLRR
jgi:diaminopimelate decarboxylase